MQFNLKVNEFHEKTINLINSSELPISVVRLELVNILNDVQNAYNRQIEIELKEMEREDE